MYYVLYYQTANNTFRCWPRALHKPHSAVTVTPFPPSFLLLCHASNPPIHASMQAQALTARVAGLQETVESQQDALDESDACLSAAHETTQRSAASLETAVAHGEAIQSELEALRELTGNATRELREELALLRAQVDGAERTAAELKTEATVAVAAAAAARASETAAAKEAAAAATEAASQHAADREAIEVLQKRAAAASVDAAEAQARADEASEEARADALAEFSAARFAAGAAAAGRRVDAGNSPMRAEDGEEEFSSSIVAFDNDARVRSLCRELDSIAAKASEMAAAAVRVGWASSSSEEEEDCGGSSTAVLVVAGRDAAAVAGEDVAAASGEAVEGEGVGGEVSRMLAVAARVAAYLETLREALVLAEENVSKRKRGEILRTTTRLKTRACHLPLLVHIFGYTAFGYI